MSLPRLYGCPRSKQISGSQNWKGFCGFNAPAWQGIWATSTFGSYTAGWNSLAGGSANFAVNDLVLVAYAGTGPWGWTAGPTYPTTYQVFKCILAITGSAADPRSDTTHFTAWDFQGAGLTPGGPSGWPVAVVDRQLWSDVTHSYLEVTFTTEFDNWPGTFTYSVDNSFFHIADGSFAYDYTIASHFAAGETYTAPGTLPDTHQSPLIFPVVPPIWVIGGGGAITTGGYAPVGIVGPAALLVSWDFSGTSLEFVFAQWPINLTGDTSPPADYDYLPTVTQTITVATEYLLSDVQSEALALLAGTTFDALSWNQSAVCSYNTDGTMAVAVTGIAATSSIGTACAPPNQTGPNATAATASGSAAFVDNIWSFSKALVDICGGYCLKTFYCQRGTPVIDCTSGTVDGYAPVEIDPPSFDPTQDLFVHTYCFTNCTCTP